MKLPPRIKPWMLVAAVWIWPAALNVISRLAHVKLDGWDAPSARELLFVAGDWLIYAIVTGSWCALSEVAARIGYQA